MNNDLIVQKSWWKQNWKWLVPIIGIVLLSIFSLLSSGFGGVLGDYTKAYADPELYEGAIAKNPIESTS
ncbi:hypothetical protein [Bizionia arctica]|uniref:Uncharacterized protein n=1 Tax=Bizionia arctica TaxID=1495645 RepID=A0A917GIH6_9FLAO|nr:hypothetical protein [Bizionia arctica]GGG47747.1 hypothetical protein GCM10010976_18910 [Bizionia arctica]